MGPYFENLAKAWGWHWAKKGSIVYRMVFWERVPTTESEHQPPFLSPIVVAPKFTDVDVEGATQTLQNAKHGQQMY